jgi:uncharacterized protein YbcI
VLAAISTGLVQLHSRYYGKGPTKAKTYLVDDTVITILKEGLTTVERTLIAEGDDQAVHEIRRSFQRVMEEGFTEVVEGATGRTVIAYMSQMHTDPDLAVEIFVLEPTGEEIAEHHEGDLAGGEARPGRGAGPGLRAGPGLPRADGQAGGNKDFACGG